MSSRRKLARIRRYLTYVEKRSEIPSRRDDSAIVLRLVISDLRDILNGTTT